MVAGPGNGLGGAAFELLGYRAWWFLRAIAARSQSPLDNVVVVGGSPRSGTTLLRTMLGRHPSICSQPETTIFLHRISSARDLGERLGWQPDEIEAWQRSGCSQMEFIERFAGAALRRSGKTVWVEKTPHNVKRFGFVRRRFPHAKLVHILRDGRDVVCSLRREPFSKVKGAAWNSDLAARGCAAQWRASVTAGLRWRGDPAYHEMRYENLVLQPEATLRALLTFLDLPWDRQLTMPAAAPPGDDPAEAKAAGSVFATSIGRWRSELSQENQRAIRPLMAPLLKTLDYEDF